MMGGLRRISLFEEGKERWSAKEKKYMQALFDSVTLVGWVGGWMVISLAVAMRP